MLAATTLTVHDGAALASPADHARALHAGGRGRVTIASSMPPFVNHYSAPPRHAADASARDGSVALSGAP